MSEKVKKEKPYTTFESKGGGFKMTNVSGDVPVAMIRGRIQKTVEATNRSSSKRRGGNAVAVTSQEVCCRKVVAGKKFKENKVRAKVKKGSPRRGPEAILGRGGGLMPQMWQRRRSRNRHKRQCNNIK